MNTENLMFDKSCGYARSHHEMIGRHLVELGRLAVGDLDLVLKAQDQHKVRFGEAAIMLGLVSETDVEEAVARQYCFSSPMELAGLASTEIVMARDAISPIAEQIRNVRTRIITSWRNADRESLAVAIAGSVRGEGRTFVAGNLAVAFAQANLRTILVDANLRNSRVHEIFNIPNQRGLSQVLVGMDVNSVCYAVQGCAALDILPAGANPPNPQELLTSERFAAAIVSLKKSYDVVLVDTPAWNTGADAELVAAACGTALVVAIPNVTPLVGVNSLVNAMRISGVTRIGGIFNLPQRKKGNK